MTIRSIEVSDLEAIKKIWENHYKNEFEFPDFVTNYLCSFVVVDENDNIIAISGLRTIVECVTLTNKVYNLEVKLEALNRVLTVSGHLTSQLGYDQIHAFVQDKVWEEFMKKAGFHSTKGSALVINVGALHGKG